MTANAQERKSDGGIGLLLPIAILVVFTLLNFATGTRYPTAWQDEVLYTDPAANSFFGHGFTSSMWPAQPYGEFWAGNVPLHQFLLTAWFHVFGFGLLSARALNYVLIVAAAAVLWRAWRRSHLIESNKLSGFALLAILCGTGITMSYRSARPDCIAILLGSLAFMAFTLRTAKSRKMALLFLGILFPGAGIQLVIFAFLLSGMVVVWTRGRVVSEFIFLGGGIIIGVGMLAGLYASHGALDHFILGVTKFSNIGVPAQSLGQRLRHAVNYFTVDKSQLGLVIVALGLLLARTLGMMRFAPQRILFALATWFIVIAAMMVLGKFPVYYSWMTGIPLGICLASTLENAWSETQGRPWVYLAVAGVIGFSTLGLPMKLAVTALRGPDRNIAELDQYVRANAISADWCLADYQAYFSLKNSSNVVVAFPYLETATAEEKAKIRMAVIPSSQAVKLAEKAGGTWKQAGPPFISRWRAIDSPNTTIRRFARRLTTNPQDADWELCVYERVDSQSNPER